LKDVLRIPRDYYAGGLMVLIGLFTVVVGRHYQLGTLTRMGPGYFPVALGVVLIGIGAMIALTARMGGGAEAGEEVVRWPDPRGAVCILLGVVAFIVLGEHGGLVPATFASVFISALGDRSGTLKSSLILAAGVTLVGVLVFSYGLQVQFPLFTW
jgi:hypothetical protein